MSLRDPGDNKFASAGDFGLASDGGRSLPMEYDDVKFIGKDCQLAEKDDYESNTTGHRQGLPRFDLGEHIEVQLGFDSLDDSVLLQDQSQREENWGSHFSREENGVLGLEADSQNIEFSSTATETCTISRHINVWSEATSSESVQMLLNSVGEDEENIVEPSIERLDTHESVDGSNATESNEPKIECLPSNTGAVLDVQCERTTEIDKQVLEKSAMDVTDNNQDIPMCLEPAADSRLEKTSASKQENQFIPKDEHASEKCKMESQSEKLYAGKQTIITDEVNTSKQVIEASKQDTFPSEIRGSSAIVQGESRKENTEDVMGKDNIVANLQEDVMGKDNIVANLQEDVMGKDNIVAYLQEGPGSSLDEHNENNTVSFHSQTSQKSVNSESQLKKSAFDKMIKDATDSSHVDVAMTDVGGKSALVTDNIDNRNPVKDSSGTAAEDDTSVEMHKMRDPSESRDNKAENCADIRTSHEQDLGPLQAILDPMEVESNEDNSQKRVIEPSTKDALPVCDDEKSTLNGEQGLTCSDNQSHEKSVLLQENNNDKSTVAEDDISVKMEIKPDLLQSGSNKPEVHVDVKTAHVQDFGQKQEISDAMEVEGISDHTEKHALGVSHENVILGETQRNQDMLLDNNNEHNGEKHLTEASNKDFLHTCNVEKSKHEDDQGVSTGDKCVVKTGIILQENTEERRDNAVETENISENISAENTVVASCSKLADTDFEGQNDGVTDEQGVSTGDKCVVKTGIILQENTEERRDNAVETENISAKDTIVASCSKLADTDFEGQNDGVTSGIIRQAKSDFQVEESEAVVISLEHEDSASVPSTGGVADNISEVSSFSNLNVEPGIMPPIEHSTPQVTVENPVSPVHKMVSNISKVSSFSNLNVEPGIMPTIEHSTHQVTAENPVSSQGDQNQSVLSITAKKPVHDDIGSLVGVVFQKPLLEASSFSTQKESAKMHEVDKTQENETEHTSSEAVLTAGENETMGGVVDSPERKDTSVLQVDIETHKHISEAISVQFTEEVVALPAEQAMTGTCQETLQINDTGATPTLDTELIKQNDELDQEFEKGVKEVDMSCVSRVQDDGNRDSALLASCCSTQNETANVQDFRTQDSCTSERGDAVPVEVGQEQENELESVSVKSIVAPRESETMEEATGSPKRKTTLLPQTKIGTGECGHSRAVAFQNPHESTLPPEQVVTGTSQESLQINDACTTTSEVDDTKQTDQVNQIFEGGKEAPVPVDSTVQDDKKTEATLSIDKVQSKPTSDSGDTSQQTLVIVSSAEISEKEGFKKAGKVEEVKHSPTVVASKETEQSGKGKDTSEVMEVSLEVGISLEPDNDSPAREGDGNNLQASLPRPIDDKDSAEVMEIPSPGKLSNSKNGGDKVDMYGTAKDFKRKSLSQSDDTFKFPVVTMNVTCGGAVDFPPSGQIVKDIGYWKPFQAAQSSEVRKENVSAVCQTGEFQAEASKKNANHVSRSTAVSVTNLIVQEDNIGSSELKAKSAPSGEKSRQASCVKELEKKPERKSRSHHEKSVESQVTSLCMTSVGPGNHPSNVCTGQEPKTSLTSPISASSTQLTVSSAVQTSTLPDLNATVAPASVLFQQPFTDSQQVQLRAQILVYGSLIQGSLPEEALMVTAFADIGVSQNGTPLVDGGRSLWDNAWHTAADRIHRKTFTNTSDVPIHTSSSSTPSAVSSKIVEGTKTPNPALVSVTDSRSSPVPGMRSTDMAASRSHPLQTRAVGTHSVGRAGNKNAPSAIMSPPRPVTLSSPVWGMSTSVNEGMQGSIPRSLHIDPHQMAATRHLYQPPQLGHYPQPGSSNPWLSPLHYPAPWLSPPQGTLPESGLPFSSFVVPEMTQESLNNRRMPATNVPHAPMTHVIPHFPGMAVPSTGHVSNAKADTASKGAVGVGRQSSNEHKSRKRKKKSVSEEIAPTGGLKPSGAQVTPVTTVSKRPSSSTPVSSQGPPMAVTTSSNALVALPTSTSSMPSVSHYQIISRGETEQRVIFSEETASRIEQAKLNAEEAASVAAAAVRHSQGIWSQLAAQKGSGIVSECEAKLASAAVAAAAAASVAKAAAAAAKVAADAAEQAKVMATEALNSDGKSDSSQTSDVRLLEGNQGHSRSIIAAARETAKKRVEAASAATKRAQNLDAVVRAAELAAQAVTQAGAVVAMGDPVPLSLSALLEAGPEAYWKLVTQQAGIHRDDNVHSETLPQEIVTQNVEKNIIHSKSKNRKDALTKETTRNVEEPMKNSSTEALKQVEKGCKLISDVAPHNIVSTDKDSIAPTENQVASTTQTAVAVSDAEAFSREATEASEVERKTESDIKALASTSNEIKEGSFVEVVSDEEGLRGVWFSAKVLSLKDGKAFVRYDELLSDEGRGQLQEWIPLEGENGKPPRIRVAHPMTVMKFEGTRKRRRAAMGSYVWSIGDRVDAWIRDGWWEGIIMDKKDDDESKLTVHFPGEGDTSIIKAWNLRPSLIWKDGQWVEWTNLMAEKEGSHEDDLPSEKRQKLDKPDTAGETRGKEKLLKIPNLEEAKKTQELNTVMLSGKDKSLVAAKNSSEDGSSTGIRLNQIGLQREGSKVVFGVPKPTKKRKFMDVSKHYVAERMTRNSPDGKSSGKFDKHKAPVFQSQTGVKVTNKVQDKKFRRPIFSKPKDLKSSRGQDGQSKTKSEKDKSSASNPPVTSDNMGQEMGQLSMPAFGNDGSKGGRRLALGGSVPNTKSGEASHPSVLKEVETHRSQYSTKINAPSAESDPGSKGKQSSASDSSTHNIEKAASRQEVTKDKVPEKAITDMVEPRRSNRKIQPTSRLLEGLQTSPTIVKSSAASHFHDKGGKAQLKSSSSIPKGNFNG